ncbi:hypothetical protein BJD55_gp196 [Gordonia phage Yvonnetastic]|uniref:Chromo domain-containing protein n=1 Tax=Gordonia phage Yvonnetastic TaxID=1821566 RepID=A0A142K8Y7_9CAUD|nr:hypothetical protein BJD55_gp196 [Gordonia phage Yvonnetastic]AMS02570.1 hypothetical protein SEA_YVONNETASTIC_26 [Gordonia phage Yvonnetastic]WKW86003.1 hypothetical protein SEA_JONJAMES_28 [Gordonia Phage JonJames]
MESEPDQDTPPPFDDDGVYELSRLTAIRLIGADGEIWYEVYWEDYRGFEEPTWDEKQLIIARVQRNLMFSELEFEVVGEDDDDDQ